MREMHVARAGRAALAVFAAGLVAVPAVQAAPQGRKPIAAAGAQATHDAVDQGAAANSAAQNLRVYLAPRGGLEALKAAVDAVSSPDSPNYGKFLTPERYRADYGATAATIKSVKAWLRSQGLKPGGVEPNGRYV